MSASNVDYDPRTGIVRCSCNGFLVVEDVRDYHAAVIRAISVARRDRGFVKLLVVSIDSRIQSAEVIQEASKLMWPMVHPSDRMAILVSSSLAKMQVTRLLTTEQTKSESFAQFNPGLVKGIDLESKSDAGSPKLSGHEQIAN